MLAYEKEIELDLSDSYAPNFLNKQLYRSTEDGWYDFVLKAPEDGQAYPNTFIGIASFASNHRGDEGKIQTSRIR